jgi:hypothetical protein
MSYSRPVDTIERASVSYGLLSLMIVYIFIFYVYLNFELIDYISKNENRFKERFKI